LKFGLHSSVEAAQLATRTIVVTSRMLNAHALADSAGGRVTEEAVVATTAKLGHPRAGVSVALSAGIAAVKTTQLTTNKFHITSFHATEASVFQDHTFPVAVDREERTTESNFALEAFSPKLSQKSIAFFHLVIM